MKVTVHLEMTNTDFGHFSDAAERGGLSLEQYIVSAALCGSAVLNQEVTP